MLVNYHPEQPLYILGNGIYAQELNAFIVNETHGEVKLVLPDNFFTIPKHAQCIIGFQNIDYRKKLLATIDLEQYSWPSYVHPTAVVIDQQSISAGVVISPLSVIGHKVQLGEFCNIGILAKVGHGSNIGLNTVISPGTNIGGSTLIGQNVFFGQQCSIRTKIVIGSNICFAINSLITKNIVDPGMYYGNKKINN